MNSSIFRLKNDCISQNLQGDTNEFLGPGLSEGSLDLIIAQKNDVTFQLKFYFLRIKIHNGNIESTSECFSGNSIVSAGDKANVVILGGSKGSMVISCRNSSFHRL